MMLGLVVGLLVTFADKAAFTAAHDDAMQRASVWEEPAVPIEDAQLDRNPESSRGFATDEVVECRFVPGGIAGTTPKFDCELPDGERVKVKYGQTNPEVYTEVAATRLLNALGFPADRMFVVLTRALLRLPRRSFSSTGVCQRSARGRADGTLLPVARFSKPEDFAEAVIERPVKGRRIEDGHQRGWTFEELKYVDAVKGGATRRSSTPCGCSPCSLATG